MHFTKQSKNKKTIAILLIIAMLLTIMPVTVFAEGDSESDIRTERITAANEMITVQSNELFNITAQITTGSAITSPSMIWYENDEVVKTTNIEGLQTVGESTYEGTEPFQWEVEETEQKNLKVVLCDNGVETEAIAQATIIVEAEKEELEIPPETCTTEYKDMSSYIDVDYKNHQLIEENDSFYVNATIGENAQGDLNFILSDAFIGTLDEYMKPFGKNNYPVMPGDHNNISITLKNESKHSYKYQDNSIVVATPDNEGKEFFDYPALGFDGQYVATEFTSARLPHKAIQALCGKTNSAAVTLEDMLTIYEKLEEKGYVGKNALTQYVLDYYNAKDNTSATKISELKSSAINNIASTSNNGFRDVSYKDSTFAEKVKEYNEKYPYFKQYAKITDHPEKQYFSVQLYEAEPELSAVLYDNFYQNLLSVAIGRHTTKEEALVTKAPLGGYYLENSTLLNEAEQYFEENISFTSEKQTNDIILGMTINGPKTGNAYAKYDFAFYSAITLEQVDGSLTIQKVDEKDQFITAPAEFLLKNEAGQYYQCNEDGTPNWVTESTNATILTTKDGAVTVDYLMPGKYSVLEVKAPEGYQIEQEEKNITVAFDENNSYVCKFKNIAEQYEYQLTCNYFVKAADGTLTKEGQVIGDKVTGEKDAIITPDTDEYVVYNDKTYTFDTDNKDNIVTVTLEKPVSEMDGKPYQLVLNYVRTESTSGGGGTTTDPDPEPPTTDPVDPTEPEIDIPDPDVPLTEPEVPEEPTIDIEDPDVPLAEVPGETVEIEEPEVPLGDAPATGDRSAAIPFAVLMLIAAAGLAITRKRFN